MKDVGALVQLPFFAVSVLPSRAVPLIEGGVLFTGIASERANATAPAAPHATTTAAIAAISRGPIRRKVIVTLLFY